MPLTVHETISAISTPPGRSGIGIIRISGDHTFEMIKMLFVPHKDKVFHVEPRKAVLGRFRTLSGEDLDEGLATCFAAPNSYTGEDLAEISLHGSPVVLSRALEETWAAGARPAEPGEFTYRAWRNGKKSLLEAEAVLDLINARSRLQAQAATQQRADLLSGKLERMRDALRSMIVDLETALDFPEEALPGYSKDATLKRLAGLLGDLSVLIQTHRKSAQGGDDARIAIIGKPNAGKSSLFNALLEQERSLVSTQPGTTRDLVHEGLHLPGWSLRLYDTAGIAEGYASELEQRGSELCAEAVRSCDVVVFVHEGGNGLDEKEHQVLEGLGEKTVIPVISKIDLCDPGQDARSSLWTLPNQAVVHTSAVTGAGIEELRDALRKAVEAENPLEGEESVMLTNLRHVHGLRSAREAVSMAAQSLEQGKSEEFVLVDLQRALTRVCEVVGDCLEPDMLEEIFSRFCIGK